MESTGNDNTFASRGQGMADKAADHVQSGIRDAKQFADSTASSLSNKAESLRSNTGPAIAKASDQARGMLDQGVNAVTDATQKVRDTVSDTTDSIVTYTKDNPVKALLIAAAVGGTLVTLIRALTPSRD